MIIDCIMIDYDLLKNRMIENNLHDFPIKIIDTHFQFIDFIMAIESVATENSFVVFDLPRHLFECNVISLNEMFIHFIFLLATVNHGHFIG